MVVNPLREEKEARNFINDRIQLIIKTNIDVDYNLLLKDCLLTFSVSRRMVETFINDFYLDTKDIYLDKTTNCLKKCVGVKK